MLQQGYSSAVFVKCLHANTYLKRKFILHRLRTSTSEVHLDNDHGYGFLDETEEQKEEYNTIQYFNKLSPEGLFRAYELSKYNTILKTKNK